MPQCQHCGAVMAPKPRDRKYCSGRCRNAAFQSNSNRTHVKDGDRITINGKVFYLYREKR